MAQTIAEQRSRIAELQAALERARVDASVVRAQLDSAQTRIADGKAREDSLVASAIAASNQQKQEIRPGAVLTPIRFAFNSSALRAEDRAFLDTVAITLENKPTIRLGLIGRADRIGTSDYNLLLSESRAVATRDYLVARGVAPWRIEVVRAGETSPIDERFSAPALANNRSVQIVVTDEAVPIRLRSAPDSATVYFFSIWNGKYREAYSKLGDPGALANYRVQERPTNRYVFRSPLGWNVMMVHNGRRAFVCGLQPVKPTPSRDTSTAAVIFSDSAYARPCKP